MDKMSTSRDFLGCDFGSNRIDLMNVRRRVMGEEEDAAVDEEDVAALMREDAAVVEAAAAAEERGFAMGDEVGGMMGRRR
mmetsp:Transcript_9307/g.34438  ORF Transcript_9307/g.34438 Transcript_9307/m.34438 type:complete len:80 (+) Transcript_9307:3107-3346(+)